MSDISAKILSIETSEDRVAAPVSAKANSSASLAIEPISTGATTACVWGGIVLWILGLALAAYFTLGGNLSAWTGLQWAGLAALALVPSILFFLIGSLAKRIAVLSSGSERLIHAADAITRPDAQVEGRVTSLAHAIRSQVIGVDSELKASMERLAGMETVLSGHTTALQNSHLAASRQTGEISQRLSEEREGLQAISTSFDERMGALSRLLTEHSDRLAQATHIAEQKIQEARVSVEGAAAKINASSEIVRDNAFAATQALTDSETKITDLGESLKVQTGSLDEINARHTAQLSALVAELRAEQDRMSNAIESRLEKMRDMSLSAKLSADHLNEASDAGQSTIEALAQSAALADEAVKKRFSEMEDMVAFSNQKAESITGRAAQRVRDSLSLTRMEISRIEDDMRELEQRLTDRTLDFEKGSGALDVTPKSGWKKSLLRFRPVDADLVDTNESPDDLSIPRPGSTAQASPSDPVKPAGLDQDSTPPVSANKTAVEPVSGIAPSPAPVLTIEQSYIAAPNLVMEPAPEPTPVATPSLDVSTAETLAASRIDPPQLRKRKESTGWSLRKLFGGNDGAADSAINTPDAPRFSSWDEQQADVIETLSALGLSPNAIVSENFLNEAVETRLSSGANRMRDGVAARLSEPVSHLKTEFGKHPDLQAKCHAFASNYYQVLGAAEGNAEKLKAQLETQTGRAFLICDAALG